MQKLFRISGILLEEGGGPAMRTNQGRTKTKSDEALAVSKSDKEPKVLAFKAGK